MTTTPAARGGVVVSRSERSRRLSQLWLDQIGEQPTDDVLRSMLNRGWSTQEMDVVFQLVAHAMQYRTGITDRYASTLPGATQRYVAEYLVRQMTAMTSDENLPWASALAWAEIAAAAPTALAFEEFDDFLALGSLATRRLEGVAAQWTALAWAAGLTVREIRDQAATGTVDEATLRGLAALRGYRFPLSDNRSATH